MLKTMRMSSTQAGTGMIITTITMTTKMGAARSTRLDRRAKYGNKRSKKVSILTPAWRRAKGMPEEVPSMSVERLRQFQE